ncbi:di-trans,poly-cis-decaprenylcistransferase [Candidatus Dependentiae bacterium]|nr:MAG: di-trans,poly-cis-decaprenylcistransferase [Candidatus Dependentiae bacterium]
MNHLACIMDGNRRWAKEQGCSLVEAYQKGLKTVEIAIDFCITKKIPYLSLFLFSLQNIQRADTEKNIVFLIIEQAFEQALSFALARNVRVFFSGNIACFPLHIQTICARVEQATKHATGLQVTLLFGYGAQEDILQALRRMVSDVQKGLITNEQITHERLVTYLWTGHIPVPDLIMRTGNVSRLSNCLLYQAAYAELYFLPVMWPTLTVDHFEQAYTFFTHTKRNFGL